MSFVSRSSGYLRTFAALAMLSGGVLESGAAPSVGEWTQFGNGPEHSGYYPRTIGSAPFQPSWNRTFSSLVPGCFQWGADLGGPTCGPMGAVHGAHHRRRRHLCEWRVLRRHVRL